MAVMRVEKNGNYTTMSNYHFKEKDMSIKAKGLLSIMLSLPEDWDYTEEGLAMLSSDGRDSIRSALKELESFGYVETARVRDEKGRLRGTEYIVREKPTLEEPMLEEPMLEKPTQLNTNILNTNILNTNISNQSGEHTDQSDKPKGRRAYYPESEELNKAFKDFVYMRKRIKRPLTNTGIVEIKSRLEHLSTRNGTFDTALAVAILKQSVMNSWPGVYELKRSRNKESPGESESRTDYGSMADFEKAVMAN